MKASTDRADGLLESLPCGVVIEAPGAVIVECNRRATELLGLTRDQLLGRSNYDPRWSCIREDGSPFPGEEHPASVSLKTGLPARGVIMGVVRPDVNDTIWLLVDAEPERGPDGSVARTVVTFTEVTRLKDVEARLRASQAEVSKLAHRFSGLFELGVLGMAEVDAATGRFVTVNRRFRTLLGYTEEELLARTFSEVTHPDDRRASTASRDRIVSGASVQETIQKRYLHKDGSVVWVELVATSLTGSGGLDSHLILVRDLTPEKVAEVDFKRLTLAVEKSRSSIVFTDRDGRIEYVNPRFTEVTGYTAEEVLGANPRVLKSGTTTPEEYRELWSTISSGHTWQGEFHNRKKNGDLYWESALISPIFDDTGTPTHFLAIKDDITEKRQVKAAHQESEERFRILIEAIPAGILVVSGHRIVFANRHTAQLLGAGSAADLLERDPYDLLVPEERAQSEARAATITAGGAVPALQRTLIRFDGTLIRVEMGASGPIRYGGEPANLVIFFDLTQRLELEAELRQAQKMEAIGTLAGGIAHDFNNLLTIILANTSQALAPRTLAEAREINTDIHEAAQRAAELTRQLLVFSRRQKMNMRTLTLNETIRGMSRMLSRIVGEDIAVREELAPELPPIRGDAGMIEQVLMNLVVNARDAMPRGGTVTIRTGCEPLCDCSGKPGDRRQPCVWLEVADSGSGIAPEVLPRIFEPFFTTKDVGKGTGLGLATVFSIAQQHGGRIDVSSTVGQGSTFRARFPAQLPTTEVVSEPDAAGQLELGTVVVLLVEDEDAVRRTLEKILKRSGYTVLSAPTAEAAQSLWEQHRSSIQLLLTDVVIPGGTTGPELAATLRSEAPALPVIFLSGYSHDRDFKMPIEPGVNYLQKPVEPAVLTAAIRRQLEAVPSA